MGDKCTISLFEDSFIKINGKRGYFWGEMHIWEKEFRGYLVSRKSCKEIVKGNDLEFSIEMVLGGVFLGGLY